MTRSPRVSYSEGLTMKYTTRRTLAGLGLGIGFLGGCSATGNNNVDDGLNPGQSGGTGGTINLGSGGTGASFNTGGTGNTIGGISGSSGGISVGADDGVVPNDDPGNGAITHPTCGIGTCTDFPDAPLMGDGVPANAASLFSDPENFSAGSLCVLEPQLSSGTTPGVMMP